jgi:hypothetical protein
MGSDIPPDRLPLRFRGQPFPVRVRHVVLSPTLIPVSIASDLHEGRYAEGEEMPPKPEDQRTSESNVVQASMC